MTTYSDRIRTELLANDHHNRVDPHTLAIVEHIMRDGNDFGDGLDWLSLNGFEYAARYALAHAEGLAAAGELPAWCAARNLTVPTWATELRERILRTSAHYEQQHDR